MDSVAPPSYRSFNPVGDEREVLEGFLDYFRRKLVEKSLGLTLEQLKMRPVATSRMSLLGLLRHYAGVEQFWFEYCLEGREPLWYYDARTDNDVDFNDLDSADLATVMAHLENAWHVSAQIASHHDLGDLLKRGPTDDATPKNLRWIYLHLIEEYARHSGHADILRELIDGTTGY